ALGKSDRDDERQKDLLAFFKGFDPKLKELESQLKKSKKERPMDAKLKTLQDQLARLEKPLPLDTGLRELRRAAELSAKQLQTIRLTSAQDVAWALINNPAFLFNH
ncbi:hypothetical protein N8737_04875, partial [Verrucomicrobia bacterium]|nr:hypothetical protein [Verrucomicrobiota bacterium]